MRHTYCIFSQYLYLRESYSLFSKCLPNQSLTNLKNPAKGTKGILVNGGSPLTRDFLLVYTLKTTKEANTGASISINGIKVCDLVTRTPNNIIEICGCVRAFKGDIITTHVASAGGYADVYAYMPNTI